MDGGLSDSIPIKKAFDDGVDKVIDAINNRNETYNNELKYMEEMVQTGKVLAIYPKEAIDMGRTERNKEKLWKCYNDGYNRGIELHNEIIDFARLTPTSPTK